MSRLVTPLALGLLGLLAALTAACSSSSDDEPFTCALGELRGLGV